MSERIEKPDTSRFKDLVSRFEHLDPPLGKLLIKYPYILRETADGDPLHGEALTVHLKKLLLRYGVTAEEVFKPKAFVQNAKSKVVPELSREQVTLQFLILRLEGWSWPQIDTAYNQDFLTDEELEALKDDELRLKNGIAIQSFQATIKKEYRDMCSYIEHSVRPVFDILDPAVDSETLSRLTALRKKFKVPHNLALFNSTHLPSNDPTTLRHIPIIVEILFKHHCLGKNYNSIVADLTHADRRECVRDILLKSKDPVNLISVFATKCIAPELRPRLDELQRIQRYKTVAQLFIQGKTRKEVHEHIAKNYAVTNEYETLNLFFYVAGWKLFKSLPKETQDLLVCGLKRNVRGWWSPSVASFIHIYGDVPVTEAIKIARKLNVRAMPEDYRGYRVQKGPRVRTSKAVDK